MFKQGDIVEMIDGGLITKVKIVLDMGDRWNIKILEHHTKSENGTFRTIKKSELRAYNN